jgi:hypothetical protein
MLDKTMKDLEEMITSIRSVKGQTFCDVLKIYVSMTSLNHITVRMAEQLDSENLAAAKYAIAHVTSMVMAELCDARGMDLEDAKEIQSWTDRFFETINSNARQYGGMQ